MSSRAAAAAASLPPSDSPAPPRGSDYAELSRQIRKAGLTDRRPGHYAWAHHRDRHAPARLLGGVCPGGQFVVAAQPQPRFLLSSSLNLVSLAMTPGTVRPDFRIPEGQRRSRRAGRQPRHRHELWLVDWEAHPASRSPRTRRGADPLTSQWARWRSHRARRPKAGVRSASCFAARRTCSSRRRSARRRSLHLSSIRALASKSIRDRLAEAARSPSISPVTSPSCLRVLPPSRPLLHRGSIRVFSAVPGRGGRAER